MHLLLIPTRATPHPKQHLYTSFFWFLKLSIHRPNNGFPYDRVQCQAPLSKLTTGLKFSKNYPELRSIHQTSKLEYTPSCGFHNLSSPSISKYAISSSPLTQPFLSIVVRILPPCQQGLSMWTIYCPLPSLASGYS
jgi:hypothetical protein